MSKTDDGLLLSGTLYGRNRRIPNSPFREWGNVSELKFESKTETKKRESHQKNQLGQILDSVTMSQGTEISWVYDTFNRENLAFTLSGEVAELPNKVSNVDDVNYTVAQRGVLIQLEHEDIDPASFEIKNKSDEAVADAYIELNPVLGLFTITADCPNVENNDTVKVTYRTRARAGYEIKAATVSDFDFELKLDGYNHASGKDCVLHCPSVKVAADGAIEWLKGDFVSANAKGDVVTVNGNKHPYSYREYDN